MAVIGSSDPAWRSSTLAAMVVEGGMSPHGNSMSDARVHTLPTPGSLCKESSPLTIPTPPPPALEPACRTLLGHALHACTFHILSTCSLMTKSGGESQLPVLYQSTSDKECTSCTHSKRLPRSGGERQDTFFIPHSSYRVG